MTKLGILVAMAVECRSLTEQKIPGNGLLALNECCLIGLSGAGPKAAQRGSALLIEAGATAMISWGCAAALDPRLNPGDLILPESLVGIDRRLINVDGLWRERLVSLLESRLSVHSGLLAESSRIVALEGEKRAIFADTGAIALDMESAASARAAEQFGLPFLAIRSIIDPASVT
ncbi:MAG: phosphorylase, partial [Candidatus Methylumidiphilus sp.]